MLIRGRRYFAELGFLLLAMPLVADLIMSDRLVGVADSATENAEALASPSPGTTMALSNGPEGRAGPATRGLRNRAAFAD